MWGMQKPSAIQPHTNAIALTIDIESNCAVVSADFFNNISVLKWH